ncbi:MAG: sugar O-acetyltransferase [Longicatena sp.]
MSEKEKMLQGQLYDAGADKELVNDRRKCKDVCFAYNNLLPSDSKGHDEILEELLKEKGERVEIIQPFWCDYGYNITLGHDVFINNNCTILDGAEVVIGNHVFIAPDCGIHTAGHPLDIEQRNAGLEYAYPITIQDNVWIGANVTILPGVTIGKNSVIGAGAVVNKDIPEGVIAAGNPCRVLRKIEEAS